MELYAPMSAELEQVEVTASLMPIGDDREVISTRADLADIRPANGSATRPAKIALPLTNVQPGEYFLRVRVRHRGETIAEMVRELRVFAGDAPRTATTNTLVRAADAASGEIARALIGSLSVSPPLERAAALAREGDLNAVAAALPGSTAATADHLVLRGLARLHTEEYAVAAEDFAAALEMRPSDARIAFLLGWAHTGAGSSAQGISAWRNAAYIDPSLVPAHLALADAYLRVSQPALAAQALRAGLTALPNSPELREKLATVERH